MCSIAAAAISLARRMRSTSCAVLSERAADEQRRRVLGAREGVEPGAAERRRLADHAIAGLRPAAQLDGHAPVAGATPARRARARAAPAAADRPGRSPGRAARPTSRRCARRRRPRPRGRSARARPRAGRRTRRSPSCPRSSSGRAIVVRRAHDERVELALGHERAHARELGLVTRPGHQRTRGGAGSPWPSCHEITGLRSTPMPSISHSMTSPGLR